MKLSKLLERLDYKVVAGSDNIEITELVNDSRKVVPGSVFVCISGAVSDGHQYVKDVAEKGAAAVIVEKDVEVQEGLTVIKVEDTRYALALMSARLGYMSEEQAERVIKLYERAGLPTRIPDYIDREELVKKLYTDKKVRDGKLRFVLQKGIGATEFAPGVYAKPIEESLAREIIMEL